MLARVIIAEKTGALAFLNGLGAVNSNSYMIRAVVAWFREESGNISRVIGNNPFNIRPGVATRLSSGKRAGREGFFLVFPSLAVGFAATALVLKTLAPNYGYGTVVKAARDNDAIGFLAALALSSWDAGHYGIKPGMNPRTVSNRLVAVYKGIPE